MAAGTLEIEIEQGADFIRVITVKDDSAQPVDLTGYTAEAMIRKITSDVSPVATFTMTILDQTSNKGQISWVLPASITTTIPVIPAQPVEPRKETDYQYDVKIISGGGIVTRLLQGVCKVSPEDTK